MIWKLSIGVALHHQVDKELIRESARCLFFSDRSLQKYISSSSVCSLCSPVDPSGVPRSIVGRSETATGISEQILCREDNNLQYVHIFTSTIIATSALLTLIN